MGLTERHWFENEEPALTDRQLEDIVYENKKVYDNGYMKGFHDARTLEKYLVEFGVKIGFLTPEKAEQLLKEQKPTVFKPHYIDKYGKRFICGVECGCCHKEISGTYHYCPYCGRPVKWG